METSNKCKKKHKQRRKDMENEKVEFLASIVKSDFTEGNEERLVGVTVTDENAFAVHFKANSAEGLKGIKLKAGYQFNGEAKDWNEQAEHDEDGLFPLQSVTHHKELYVKMTGAKRGKTLLEMNKKFGVVKQVVEPKAVDKTEPTNEESNESGIKATPAKKCNDDNELRIEIPETAIQNDDVIEKNDDKIHAEKAEAKVSQHDRDESAIVKPSLGEDWSEVQRPQTSNEKNAVEESSKTPKCWMNAIGDKDEAFGKVRCFMYKFIYALGEIKTVDDFTKFLDTTTEEQCKHLQIMMKSGEVHFKEEFKTAFFAYLEKRGWEEVAWVDAPTYEDLEKRTKAKEKADADADAFTPCTEDGTLAEPLMAKQTAKLKKDAVDSVSVEQKPDTSVNTNFEDEDYEALNPHGRIANMKRTMTRCMGFLPRSSVNVNPDGDCEGTW